MKNMDKQEYKKITVNLPAHLLANLPEITGKNMTESIEEALRELRHRWACNELLKLKGKVKFEMTWQEMKALRD